MTIKLDETYVGRVDTTDPDYQWGKGRNIQGGVPNTGTPFDEKWFNDFEGNKQALLRIAGIVPSGVSDSAVNSDQLEAMKRVQRGFLVGNPVGSFKYGFEFTSANDVGIDNDGNFWKYSGAGSYPITVAADTDPTSGDFTQAYARDGQINPVGNFSDGVTFNFPNDAAKDTGGEYWVWTGALPYTATAGTVPSSPDYKKVFYNSASNVNTDDGKTAQDTHNTVKAILVSQGLSGAYGYFADGFTLNDPLDVGIDASYQFWKYTGAETLPYAVPSGTDPSAGDWELVGLNDHSKLINRNAVGAHDEIYDRRFDSFSSLIANQATTPAFGVLKTKYYSVVGDDGGAEYRKDGTTGTPNTGDEFKFYDANGEGWAIQNSNIKSEMFGNDMSKLQLAFDAAERGTVTLKKDAVLNRTGSLNLPKLTTLNLNGATLNISVDGNVRGLEVNDKSTVKNGNVFVNGTNAGGGGANHAPISGGNQGTGVGVVGATVENVNVDTNRSDGNGIVMFGDSRKCKVKNIGWPDSSTMSRVVAFEWGGPSTGNDNGHPNNNEIKNISGGQLTTNNTASYVVWLSSCFNVEVTNVFSPNANGCVGIFTGDEAADHANLDYKEFVGSGIIINNPSGKYKKYGCRVYGKGSNVVTPLFERPIINNPNFEGDLLDDGAFGVLVEFSGGVVVNNPNIRRFGYGLSVGQGGQNVQVNGGDIYENRRNGVRFGNIAGVSDCFANSVRVYKNNQANGAGVSSAAGIALAYANKSGVKNCKFGLKVGETETQQYSIFLESTCLNCDMTDNHTYTIKNAGVAYVNGGSSDYDMNTTGINNTVEVGITLNGGAPTYTINSFGRRFFMFSGSSGFPAAGTWQQGDSFYYSAPLQSGGTLYYIGGVYTAGAGWINYGQTI